MTAPASIPDIVWELGLNAVTAAFASAFGAIGAWGIARRYERADRVTAEIAAVNVAIGLSTVVANTAITVKKQNIIEIVAIYRRRFREYAEKIQYADAHPNELVSIEVIADLRSI